MLGMIFAINTSPCLNLALFLNQKIKVHVEKCLLFLVGNVHEHSLNLPGCFFFRMRYVAAYLLAALGGNENPEAKDIKKILDSVGIEADDTRLSKVQSGCCCSSSSHTSSHSLSLWSS